jgi:negative regulator of flagellin synthesis FlgM
MKIDGSNPEVVRPELARPVTGSHAVVSGKTQPAGQARPAVERADSVQISDAGRAMAERTDAARNTADSLSAERAEDIRQRIQSGVYDSAQVAEQVARRMLDRGDV